MSSYIPSPALPSDFASNCPPNQYRDNTLGETHCEFRWEDPFNLPLQPIAIRFFRKENLSQDGFRNYAP